MKTKMLRKTSLFLLASLFSIGMVSAQSVSVTSNYPSSLVKPASGNIGTSITRSSATSWSGWPLGSFSWTVSPNTGVTLSGNDDDQTRIIQFSSTAAAGTYTITVTYNALFTSNTSRSVTVTLTNLATADFNLWAAKSTDASTSRVEAFKATAGTLNSGPSTLFYTGETFAALGRSQTGHFYWIPYSAGTNGVLQVKGVTGTGSSPTTVLSSFDINGSSNTDVTFVRLAIDKNNAGWILTSSGSNLNLTRVQFNGLSTATAAVIDDNVTLTGGSPGTFQNGDLVVDGSGNLYVLANNSGGLTEIYSGQPNGSSTTLTKRWEVKAPGGGNFTGSVNGCAFDADGSLYLTTSTGVYYLNPASIEAPASGFKTITAQLVYEASDYTDLASSLFPTDTPLPVQFAQTKGFVKDNQLKISWTTASENNSDRFEVMASKDGVNFKTIGTVASKAQNGFSDKALQYDFTLDYKNTTALLGISLLSLAFVLLLFNRRNKILLMLMIVAGMSFTGASCSKSSAELIDTDTEGKLFVKIKQIDKDGNFDYSAIFTVYRAD